jgi:quercetin dioxygenase-like cupin family protein
MRLERIQEPPGAPSPYIIPTHGGETIAMPGAKFTIRILASAKETENLISVFQMIGTTGDPAGFHYHNEAHDIFLCTKGRQKVWVGDQCRILGPGDFCSVPPVSILRVPRHT